MRGKSPASLAITVDSEPGTIRYLGHQILKELESKNITVLAMCFGYRGIDIIKTPDDTLVKSILGINQDQNIVFEVKFKACNGTFKANCLLNATLRTSATKSSKSLKARTSLFLQCLLATGKST
ncbi:hypothetical protein H4Q26_002073 [Puccinia striiformis f. sp. tritici PST-130]|nr:hypothetical protein H4Q26_002073 [Puccinia striiformis f. sp. tritici PST-130]